MTESSTILVSRAAVACPPWCQGSLAEHAIEIREGDPVDHFRWFPQEGTPSVCLMQLVPSRGADPVAVTTISVGDDDAFDIDMAERVALAMLEAVKVARS